MIETLAQLKIALMLLSSLVGQMNAPVNTPILGGAVLGADTSIIDSLTGKTAIEKADIKATAISQISIPKQKRTDKYFDGYLETTKSEVIEGGVQVFVKAWDAKDKPIAFGDGSVEIEKFKIINPPILVDDASGTIIREQIDRMTGQNVITTWREDPREALLQSLTHTIKVKKEKYDSSKMVSGKVGNTTLTCYPDANPESTSVDGMAGRDTNGTWAQVHDGAGDFSSDIATNNWYGVWNGATTDQIDTISRFIMLCDTAGVGSTSTVSAATFSLYGINKADTIGTNSSFSVVSSSPASNTAIVNADYQQLGSTSFGTIVYGDFSTVGYNDIALNATGIATISKTGVSKLGLRSYTYDALNTAPPWANGSVVALNFYEADQAGTTSDPKLVVEYAATPAPPAAKTQQQIIRWDSE